jgi:hypothetical protein
MHLLDVCYTAVQEKVLHELGSMLCPYNTLLQDIFILKLMTEIANLGARLAILEGQLKLKECERNQVGQSVADANADLESLRREHQRLLQAWNSVFISIQQRDKVFMNVTQDYRYLCSSYLVTVSACV